MHMTNLSACNVYTNQDPLHGNKKSPYIHRQQQVHWAIRSEKRILYIENMMQMLHECHFPPFY